MHVVIVGCGRVGSGLARSIESEGHTVAIIDRRPKAFIRLPADFKGRAIVGVGFDRGRLEEAGIGEAGAVAAVTNGDNSNILVARVARETYGIERVIARIYDPRRAAVYERLGISTVATVAWTNDRILRRVIPEQAAVEWIDPSARVCLVERPAPGHWAGTRYRDLTLPDGTMIAAVSRMGVSQVPTSELVVQEGDVIYAAVGGDAIDSFDSCLAEASTGKAH